MHSRMSETKDYSTWPPKDLIADLAINTNPEPEDELDENVAKGMYVSLVE